MKTKTFVFIMVLLLIVFVILESYGENKGFYIPSANEELYVTWVNNDYSGGSFQP